ncbi:glutamine-hydrolyzing carbamoyl-phosphate synthase small subunit [Ignicoccus islandicus]|uniref:glutamine-hydrolyzing carbamoyl-phosphate synthase small subunit n=1 Tax=Ignicoccus islandicus TaxID=54259 RepID=UPI0009461184|nr:glutamine-hydrolyzing carbamoyl-phosphate synthase small subunit [Ignicoccus islandicus]
MDCEEYEKGYLILEDGTELEGCLFGKPQTSFGEVVFTTTMNGYPESLTDPSYKGQILVFTHPMVGNYGVPSPKIIHEPSGLPLHYESDGIKVEGFVISWLTKPNHWASVESLEKWFEREGKVGIWGIDTRMVVKKLRENGVMMGAITTDTEREAAKERLAQVPRYDQRDFVESVVPKKELVYGNGRKNVIVIDCGIKYGIIRELVERGLTVTRVPCNEDLDKFLGQASGVVFGNGPGNPTLIYEKYGFEKKIEAVIEYGLPILAICLGHQLLNMYFGSKIYKMKYGHRGVNKPVKDGEKCFIVSENHGFAVDPKTLNRTKLEPWFFNPDDGTLEGVRSKDRKILSVQFHPESSPGPHDTRWIFDLFAKNVGMVE